MSCPACSAKSRKWFQLHDLSEAVDREVEFQVDRCVQCESSFLNPMPTPAQLAQAYSKNYYSFAEIQSSPEQKNAIRRWSVLDYFRPFFFRNHIHLLDEELGWTLTGKANPKTILDVGCGSGQYTYALSSLFPNAQVFGQDEFLDFGKVNNSDRVRFVKSLQSLDADAPFDLIVVRNVLEHFTNPNDALKKLRTLAGPETRMFVQTPNVNSLDRRLFGRYWFGFEIPRHTVVFSRKGLRSIADNTGWKLTKTRSHFVPTAWLYFLSLDYWTRGHFKRPVSTGYWKWLLLPFSLFALLASVFEMGGDLEAVLVTSNRLENLSDADF